MTRNLPDPNRASKSSVLQATVSTASQEEYRGDVDGAEHRLVTITFAREGGPHFPIADELTVAFRSREIFEPFVARSRVIFRQDDPFRSRYKFEFSEKDAQTLNAIFKRRAAVRMRPDEDLPVQACAPGGESSGLVACDLRDISKTGLSLRVAGEGEARLYNLDRLQLDFQLPGDDLRFDLEAEVRYRQLVDEHVHYGLEFDRLPAGIVQRIEAYIQRRQNEIIERTLGSTWLANLG
jgi:hypothetical protein